MAVLLTVTQGPDQGKSLRLEAGRTYRVGCDSSDDLTLTDPMVLKGHCSLEVGAEGVILRNHTASAGTFIGEKKVAQARIPGRATFRIGDSALTIQPAPAQPPPPEGQAKPAEQLATRRPRGGEDDPLVGKIIGGYKLLEVVGRGGMGVVYKAVQLSLQREVALKVLARKLSTDKNFRDLFINEARAAAQLVHPNIVQVYDAGSEGDVTYFSMEYIGQGSVEEILARDKTIAWPEAILMVLEAAHGLQYAENKGIVHRDIKPDNLMLNDDGRIKIADLGLAKRGEGGPDQGIIGTPHFIPPEQALGKDVDTRADIYSLGATFFRMITGRTVFSGKTAKEIVLKHIKEPPPAASSIDSEVPGELDAVIAKMLAKEPDQRYANATELIHALETVCAHHGIKGSIIKKGVSKLVLVPLVLLLIGAGFAVYHFAMRDPEVYVDDTKIKELEQQAKADEAKRQKELARLAQEKRKATVQSDWRALDGNYWRAGGDKGVYSHRDELDGGEDAREQQWREWAGKFDEFAKREDVDEFEGELGLRTKATEKAEWIRTTIDEVKKTVEDKQAKIGAALATIQKLDKDFRAELDKLIREQKYSDAYILAERLSREKPPQDDPFRQILSQKWVSPINPKVSQPYDEVDRLVKAVQAARDYFGERKEDIPRAAEDAWKAIQAKTPEPGALAAATDKDLSDALEVLKPVLDNYGSAIPRIGDARIAANSRHQTIQRELEKRARAREAGDRQAIKDTLRQHRSLDPDVLPNTVMNADFPAARTAWQRLLDNGTVKTERYKAFVRERIEALRYIEWLFARFQADVRQTDLDKGSASAPLSSLNSELDDDGRTHSFKFDKPEADDIYRFWLSRRVNGTDNLTFGSMGMDWVYEFAFREPESAAGSLRWRDPSPLVRFSVALFCFETMQYDEAAEHFKRLVEDETYGAVAQSFSNRAVREAKARADYVALLRDFRAADSSDKVETVRAALKEYGKQHAGTLFYIDVMSNSEPVTKDVYPDPADSAAKVPLLPSAPDSLGK